MKAIAINQRMLEDAKNAESIIAAVDQSLGNLWFAKGHAINGLPYWNAVDDRDREMFEKQQAERAKKQADDGSSKAPPTSSTGSSASGIRTITTASGSRVISPSASGAESLPYTESPRNRSRSASTLITRREWTCFRAKTRAGRTPSASRKARLRSGHLSERSPARRRERTPLGPTPGDRAPLGPTPDDRAPVGPTPDE